MFAVYCNNNSKQTLHISLVGILGVCNNVFIGNANKQELQMNNAIRYDIIDIQTQKVVSSHVTRAVAKATANRKDIAHGAIRHVVKAVYA